MKEILNQEQLVEDFLRPWVGAIERERDLVGGHAVWWAVENLVAATQIADLPHLFLTYEALLTDQKATVERMLAFLDIQGWPDGLDEAMAKPSRYSRPKRRYASVSDRLTAWQKEIPGEAQQRILWWQRELGLDLYNEGTCPIRDRPALT